MPWQAARTPGARVHLLDFDPELARWLRPAELAEAREACIVPTLVVEPGPWTPPPWSRRDTHLGYLLLDGLLERDELIAGTTATELIGPGELVQPETRPPEETLLRREIRWSALDRCRIAVLVPSCTREIARWPALMAALIERGMTGSSRSATQHAISQLPRADQRLLLLLWHLAERYGRVGPSGVLVPLRLSHETLGHLIGAKRSTVTLAVSELLRRGIIDRGAGGAWILRGDPPTAPAAPVAANAAAQTNQ